mmetsp:Transcript_34145/g.51520  ORF Transcript_34145/g.51520 Transcript_34145/m.51520 type:complete len:617 (+) Transcript_34145:60-1910(+)
MHLHTSKLVEMLHAYTHTHTYTHKSGMQTWEYAPQYALRTYAYLLPMVQLCNFYGFIINILPTKCVQILMKLLSPSSASSAMVATATVAHSSSSILTMEGWNNKPLLFHLLRSSIAAIAAMSELSLHSALYSSLPSSPSVAHWFLLSSLTSAGAFHASGAYLPSSTVMILWMFSAANQLRGKDARAIFWGLVAVLAVGWPFCAALFVTTGFWAVWKKGFGDENNDAPLSFSSIIQPGVLFRIASLLGRTALHAIFIQFIVMVIDYQHYGQIVSPILNIFIYNTKGGGDELYGVEPTSYYVKNLLLNLNLVALWGLISLPILLLRLALSGGEERARTNRMLWKKITILLPMYIWLAIVVPRPHKEERFLFPIYPMLCVGAAITIDEVLSEVLRLVDTWMQRTPNNAVAGKMRLKLILGMIILLPSALVSMSRAAALTANYASPLAMYEHLFYNVDVAPSSNSGASQTKKYVCTGGEWYRFPSSFHLPPNVELAFLKSSFSGQLPQPFTIHGSKEKSLAIQQGKFNDDNKEEIDRYLTIEQCSYVVELIDTAKMDGEELRVPECIEYMNSDKTGQWKEVASYNFLDIDKTSALHRILYLPWGREKVFYKGYAMFERVD